MQVSNDFPMFFRFSYVSWYNVCSVSHPSWGSDLTDWEPPKGFGAEIRRSSHSMARASSLSSRVFFFFMPWPFYAFLPFSSSWSKSWNVSNGSIKHQASIACNGSSAWLFWALSCEDRKLFKAFGNCVRSLLTTSKLTTKLPSPHIQALNMSHVQVTVPASSQVLHLYHFDLFASRHQERASMHGPLGAKWL